MPCWLKEQTVLTCSVWLVGDHVTESLVWGSEVEMVDDQIIYHIVEAYLRTKINLQLKETCIQNRQKYLLKGSSNYLVSNVAKLFLFRKPHTQVYGISPSWTKLRTMPEYRNKS